MRLIIQTQNDRLGGVNGLGCSVNVPMTDVNVCVWVVIVSVGFVIVWMPRVIVSMRVVIVWLPLVNVSVRVVNVPVGVVNGFLCCVNV